MRKLMVVACVAIGALGLVAGSFAAGGYGDYPDDTTSTASATSPTSTVGTTSAGSETYSFTAAITGAAEVPKPTGVPAKAGGTFTAKSVESGSKVTFRWVLKFHNLSGKAMAAHVHLGKKGKAGPVAVALCGPCKNGQSGSSKITSAVETALEKGTAYVNIHTAKNAAGEVRGQVKLTGK